MFIYRQHQGKCLRTTNDTTYSVAIYQREADGKPKQTVDNKPHEDLRQDDVGRTFAKYEQMVFRDCGTGGEMEFKR